MPPGIILVSVDRITGEPESGGAGAIQEAYKAGTEPGAASYLDQTAAQTDQKPTTTTQGPTVDEGTGGLY
jgi:hypothetical protein